MKLVLVDFDDTLVETAPRFARRRARLFDFLKEQGFAREEAERIHHEVVDAELLDILGFGPFRLGPSFRDTYVRLCWIHGRTPKLETAREAEGLAAGVEEPGPPFPGALSALDRLASRLPTAIYTQSGFPAYQMNCLKRAGILSVIPRTRVRITPDKTPAAFRETAHEFGVQNPEGVVMVGNSVRSDVNPALQAGAEAIWVNGGESWHHDRAEPLARVPTAPTFVHAVKVLLDG